MQKQVRSGWATKEVSPGVQLSHKYFSSLFHAPENINMINIDLADTTLKISIAYNDSLLEAVSEFGKADNAIAAVNGNFFNTHIGGSVCFLKVDGRVSTIPTMNWTAHCIFRGSIPLRWQSENALRLSSDRRARVGTRTTTTFLPLFPQAPY